MISNLFLAMFSLLGLLAFVFPLLEGRSNDIPTELFVGIIIAATVVLLGLAIQANRLSTRLLAVLAALIAVDASLRVVSVIGLYGFSPIFLIILTGGFVMGASFGFALGAMAILVSALLTAGIGPWLPYQMLGCGFVGLFAGLIGAPFQKAPLTARVIALGSYGALAGFAYGMLLDLWDWPLLLNDVHSGVGFAPGLPFAELIRRFSGFYLASSLFYDAFRAAGNLILVLVVGGPLIVALERFRLRFLLEWRAADASNIPQHARIRSAGAAGGTGRAS